MTECKQCKGSGKITLLTSVVDCECVDINLEIHQRLVNTQMEEMFNREFEMCSCGPDTVNIADYQSSNGRITCGGCGGIRDGRPSSPGLVRIAKPDKNKLFSFYTLGENPWVAKRKPKCDHYWIIEGLNSYRRMVGLNDHPTPVCMYCGIKASEAI